MEDVKLTFADDALKVIARKAIERKTGARGLRSIMESILLEPMFDLPGNEEVREVVINKEAAEKRAEPLYIYAEKKKEGAKTAS
jgi:ATP-dependent Clp protease ATP-binding subunit ClpX